MDQEYNIRMSYKCAIVCFLSLAVSEGVKTISFPYMGKDPNWLAYLSERWVYHQLSWRVEYYVVMT